MDGSPGFSGQILDYLKLLVQAESRTGGTVLVSLQLDEMAIFRHVTFNRKTFIGNVNLGTDIDQDESALATDSEIGIICCRNDLRRTEGPFFNVFILRSYSKFKLYYQHKNNQRGPGGSSVCI